MTGAACLPQRIWVPAMNVISNYAGFVDGQKIHGRNGHEKALSGLLFALNHCSLDGMYSQLQFTHQAAALFKPHLPIIPDTH